MLLPFSSSAVVPAETEFAGALARHEQRRGRQKRPVEPVSWSRSRKSPPSGPRPCRWPGIPACRPAYAGRDLEAAGAADDEIAPDAGGLHRLDQLVRIAGEEMHRADHGVMALDGGEAVLRRASPFSGVTPGSAGIFSGLRAMAVTVWPRRDSSARMRDPNSRWRRSVRFSFVASSGNERIRTIHSIAAVKKALSRSRSLRETAMRRHPETARLRRIPARPGRCSTASPTNGRC